jgi:hypothetical protein
MSTYSVSGTFESSDHALDAGEKIRELAGEEATIHLLLPGKQMVEASVKATGGDWTKIAVLGFAVGLTGAYTTLSILGASFALGVVGLVVGVAAGALLGIWLQGERFEARFGEVYPGSRASKALSQGHAVVRITVASRRLAERVRKALEDSDGYLESESSPPRARIDEATA